MDWKNWNKWEIFLGGLFLAPIRLIIVLLIFLIIKIFLLVLTKILGVKNMKNTTNRKFIQFS